MTQKSPITPIAIGLALVLGGAASATMVARYNDLGASREPNLADLVATLQQRVDRIEGLIRDTDQANRAEPSIQRRSANQMDPELDRRLTAIEDTLVGLLDADWDGLDTGPRLIDSEPEGGGYQADTLPVAGVLTTHASESGVSPWAEQTAFAVENQYASAPFFGRFGGDLSTDCRQTTCKLEWSMPPAESLAPEDADMIRSFAHYELAALAAAEGRPLGQFDIEWDTSGATPSVAVYLRQPE
jgi:hypothetical protein